jgi:hypothetical protein
MGSKAKDFPITVHIAYIQFKGYPGVDVQQVFRADSALLQQDIPIDSSIPQIWLPLDACKAFKDFFHLTWSETLQFCLVNHTAHQDLRRHNSSVTFGILGDDNTITNFTLPYSAFDLNVSYPISNNTMSYFPLKRASSPEQYMLGRTFLQETYISVDYDRWVFNISQVYSRGNPRVFAITSPSNATSDVAPHHFRISSGVYAGIGVGAGLTILALALAVLLWHNKGGKAKQIDKQEKFDKAEMHGQDIPRAEAMAKDRGELDAIENSQEVFGTQLLPWELEGSNPMHELDVSDRGG